MGGITLIGPHLKLGMGRSHPYSAVWCGEGWNECQGGKPNNTHSLCQQRTLLHRRLTWQPILGSLIWLVVFKSFYSNIVLSAPQGTHVPKQIWALYWINIWLRRRNNPISFPSPHRGLITNPFLLFIHLLKDDSASTQQCYRVAQRFCSQVV